MNYCKNCGAVILPDQKVCQNCGEKVKNGEVKKRKGLIEIFFVAGVVIFIVAVIVGMKFYRRYEGQSAINNDTGYKDVVNEMMVQMYVNHDADKLLSLYAPAELENFQDENFDGNADEMKANVERVFRENEEKYPQGFSTVFCNIVDEEDITPEQLHAFQERYKNLYNTTEKVQSVKAVDVNVAAKTTDGQDVQEHMYLLLYYIDGQWYVSMEE